MEGWIKLHRKISDNKLWTSEPFTRGQAWVDLLLLANHEEGYFYLRDHKISVQRGQVGWSIVKLSVRWKWSRSKTQKFINDLEKEQQVIQQQSHSTSIITIINYEIYQEKEQQVIQQKDNRKATERQQKDTNKNDKNNKNENNINERKLKFAFTLEPFLVKYGKDMINDFYKYWTEPNKSNTKFRQEIEKTWSLERRLETWAKNDKNFKPNQQTQNNSKVYQGDIRKVNVN